MLRIAAREEGKPVEIIPDTDVAAWLQKPSALVWVDIRNTDDNDYIWLARYFDFHPMAMEDVLENHLRPKMDLFGDHAFMVYYGACRNDETNEIELQEVELFFGANYVVTVHDEPLEVLEHTFHRWQSNVATINADAGALLYNIMDSVMDSYFPVLDWVTERLDTLETRILERYSPELLRDVVGLKQGLLRLRKVVGPQRDVVNAMLRGECSFLPSTAEAYLQDLYDHALRIVESVDNYREMTTTVMDGLRSAQNNEINEVMRRLTILNLLFLPLAVLTGFFGMNFTGIPFDNPWLMIIALCAMVILPFSLYQYLQSKRWL